MSRPPAGHFFFGRGMTIGDIHRLFTEWAPPEIAWERDAIGLQVGDPEERLRGILVALEATPAVIAEAHRGGMNLLVTHHPLLFRPLRAVTGANPAERMVRDCVRAGIAVYSAHTNLDFTRGGTSWALAARLGLRDVAFLTRPYRLTSKVVTFVPPAYVDRVARAMADAGAGTIGAYRDCSFRVEGAGTFRGDPTTRPFLGAADTLEQVREVRLEMVTPRRRLDAVLQALRGTHPYEEVAYDVLPLDTVSPDYGMGAVGTLSRTVSLRTFLRSLRRSLAAHAVRWTGDPASRIRRVALCGGAGADLLDDAVRSGAEVFVTADVKYHAFHDALGRLALVDAGHYETEAPVLDEVVARLRTAVRSAQVRIPVRRTRRSTNPVAGM